MVSEGPGSHGKLYSVDRKKEIGKGLLANTLADLGTDVDEFWRVSSSAVRVWRTEPLSDTYNYPAEIERDGDGRYVFVFPDFGGGQRTARFAKRR